MKDLTSTLAIRIEATVRAYNKGILVLLDTILEKENRRNIAYIWFGNMLKQFETDYDKAQLFLGLYREIPQGHNQAIFIGLYKETMSPEVLLIALKQALENNSSFYEFFIETIILQAIYSVGTPGGTASLSLEEWDLNALASTIALLEKDEDFHYNIKTPDDEEKDQKDYGAIAEKFQGKISTRIDKIHGYDFISQVLTKASASNKCSCIKKFLYGVQLRIAGSTVSIEKRKDLLLYTTCHHPILLCSHDKINISEVFKSFIEKNKNEEEIAEDLKSALRQLNRDSYITDESLKEALKLLPAEIHID